MKWHQTDTAAFVGLILFIVVLYWTAIVISQ